MADKKGLDVGLIFGPPPKGAMGPDNTQIALAHKIFDDAVPIREKITALHDYIHSCIDDAKADEDADTGDEEAPASEKAESGGY